MEIWRDVKGFEGYYKISDFGNVKSMERKGRLKTIFLKPMPNRDGYLHVHLSKGNIVKIFTIHKLVAIHFLNHVPCGYKEIVDHEDHNKLNNHVGNLRLTTNRDNCSKDRHKHNYSSRYIGVYWNKIANKWHSAISINGKQQHLGSFNNEVLAAKAYQEKLAQIKNPPQINVKG